MANEVRVEAQAHALGLRPKQRVTVERTDLVDTYIKAGLLAEVTDDAPEPPASASTAPSNGPGGDPDAGTPSGDDQGGGAGGES